MTFLIIKKKLKITSFPTKQNEKQTKIGFLNLNRKPVNKKAETTKCCISFGWSQRDLKYERESSHHCWRGGHMKNKRRTSGKL